MGDGAGILIQIPDEFYRAEMARQGVTLPPPGEYGVGMIFLPKEHASRLACEQELERAVRRGPGAAGLARRAGRPRHADVAHRARQGTGDPPDLHRPRPRRDRARRAGAQALRDPQDRQRAIQALKLTHSREYYVPSMSCRTVIYKGLLLADQVGKYYLDLADARVVSAWRWCTSAFPPTPSPSGRWHTPTAWWRTTARSTPSRATSTGCARAKA
jgi:glutamate synthase (NADPH/NADH) large chain